MLHLTNEAAAAAAIALALNMQLMQKETVSPQVLGDKHGLVQRGEAVALEPEGESTHCSVISCQPLHVLNALHDDLVRRDHAE